MNRQDQNVDVIRLVRRDYMLPVFQPVLNHFPAADWRSISNEPIQNPMKAVYFRPIHLLILLASGIFSIPANAAPSRWNIVILYADDMGYGDLGANNSASKIPTPHLDRLAAEGLRFTDGHSSSGICTPSRCRLRPC